MSNTIHSLHSIITRTPLMRKRVCMVSMVFIWEPVICGAMS